MINDDDDDDDDNDDHSKVEGLSQCLVVLAADGHFILLCLALTAAGALLFFHALFSYLFFLGALSIQLVTSQCFWTDF